MPKSGFGRWFTEMCKQAGYETQQSAGEAMGISRVQIQRWMAGTSRPKWENIPAIAHALRSVTTPYSVYAEAGYQPPPELEAPPQNIGPRLEVILRRLPPDRRSKAEDALEQVARVLVSVA